MIPGDECSENSDCPQSTCTAVNALCEKGYCVFRKTGPKSCADFKNQVCGNGICEANEKDRCPEDCKESEVFKALPVLLPELIPQKKIINDQDSEITLEIINKDPNHNLESYLTCDIPNDVLVTRCENCGTVGALVISQTVQLDSAPSSKTIRFSLSSQTEGIKTVICNGNYVLFREDKGYITEDGKYISNKRYQQITKTIQIGKEIPSCGIFCKLKKWAQDLIHNEDFILKLGLILLLLLLICELRKYTFTTRGGYTYFRIRRNSVPERILNKVKQAVKKHHPLTLRKKFFRYKDRKYHYIITIDFLKIYRYYRMKRGVGPLDETKFPRLTKFKYCVTEFLIWWIAFAIGVWLSMKLITYGNIPYSFVNLLLVGLIIEITSKVMQVFRYHIHFDKHKVKRFLFWSLIHSLSYLIALSILNHFGIVNIYLKIVLIGLGLTVVTYFVWKIGIDRKENWTVAIVLLFIILLYLTKGFSDIPFLLKDLLNRLLPFFEQLG